MKQMKIIMGMPITVEVADNSVTDSVFAEIFSYFLYVDEKFSTYKNDSEIMRINRSEIKKSDYSDDMMAILSLSEKTKKETGGYFNIARNGKCDPSGLVKGWAVYNASKILKNGGFSNFYIDAGGDIEVGSKNSNGKSWKIGIRSPFNHEEVVKVIHIKNGGVATSGTYERGKHIYNPNNNYRPADEILSLTVIGPNIYEADRFATAAFAMGRKGINFIEDLSGLEGYAIDKNGLATMTSNFEKYVQANA